MTHPHKFARKFALFPNTILWRYKETGQYTWTAGQGIRINSYTTSTYSFVSSRMAEAGPENFKMTSCSHLWHNCQTGSVLVFTAQYRLIGICKRTSHLAGLSLMCCSFNRWGQHRFALSTSDSISRFFHAFHVSHFVHLCVSPLKYLLKKKSQLF